ncbi:MAG TPA: hypothetical protein VNW29_02895 [Candidatus Sulfotelmatobacter sp.]|jgi:hypothetical protein|nr:hypothetical protein [Candidatus Sulfotelmatobacter sp.]
MSLQKDIKDLQRDVVKALKKAKKEVDTTDPYNPKKQEDTTRSTLALIFVWGYFGILGGGIFLVLVNNIIVDYFHLEPNILINLKDFIPTISSAIGTSLGFVVGYYFKSSEGNNRS